MIDKRKQELSESRQKEPHQSPNHQLSDEEFDLIMKEQGRLIRQRCAYFSLAAIMASGILFYFKDNIKKLFQETPTDEETATNHTDENSA